MAGYGLSKSRITAWKQCPKRLWLQIHQPGLLEVSGDIERSFQIGYEVGEVAQGLFPHGILIEDDHDLLTLPDSFWVTFTPRPDEVKRLLNTQHHLDSTCLAMTNHPDSPIFEATFEHDGVLVRADLLLPTPKGYRMVEVKSSTRVKPYHIDDCAVQAWVLPAIPNLKH